MCGVVANLFELLLLIGLSNADCIDCHSHCNKFFMKRIPKSMKQVTPRQLAYLLAMAAGVILFFVLLFFKIVLNNNATLLQLLILSSLVSLVIYLLFYYALEYFIYRRIKLIYKNIHQIKLPAKSPIIDKVNMDENMIAAVEDEVEAWNNEKLATIERYKELEMYRREYIGNVSHELKTPIFVLQAYLETLLDGGINDPEISYAYIEKSLKNAERLGNIVKDLETIARHEAGQITIRWERFKIMDLCKEVFDELDAIAQQAGVVLLFKEGCEKQLIVEADREKIRHVLLNLISNGIAYRQNKQPKVWLAWYDMDKSVLIEVSDNGIGIDNQHLPRLFERFYRIDSSRSRESGGSGLGLAIVKHLIEAHGQTIHVRSTPNVGTTFGFLLRQRKSL